MTLHKHMVQDWAVSRIGEAYVSVSLKSDAGTYFVPLSIGGAERFARALLRAVHGFDRVEKLEREVSDIKALLKRADI